MTGRKNWALYRTTGGTVMTYSLLKEHNHVFAHAQEFDFTTGG